MGGSECGSSFLEGDSFEDVLRTAVSLGGDSDTLTAIIRRILHKKSPFAPDRGHLHHKLIDMGFNQKQSVAILYMMSGLLGLSAVVLTSSGEIRAIMLILAVLLAFAIGYKLFKELSRDNNKTDDDQE